MEDARRFEQHLAPILDTAYRVAHRLTRDPDDAQDLVQDAAFLAFRAFHQFAEGTNFKAWYFRILTNRFYQRHRRGRREPATVELDDVPALYLHDRCQESGFGTGGADPADAFLARVSTEAITRAVDALPEEFRLVTALHLLEEFGYREIAAIADCPIGTVRSRLHRGRRLLQKALWSLALEEGVVPPARAKETG